MGDLTKNLSRSEFECECGCGYDTIDYMTVVSIQHCIDHLENKHNKEVMVIVSGGNRCTRHNTREREIYKESNGLKGSNTGLDSQHIYARAGDIKLFFKNDQGKKGKQIEPEIIAKFFEKKYPKFGIGRYHNRTHVDSRSNGPARWDTRG